MIGQCRICSSRPLIWNCGHAWRTRRPVLVPFFPARLGLFRSLGEVEFTRSLTSADFSLGCYNSEQHRTIFRISIKMLTQTKVGTKVSTPENITAQTMDNKTSSRWPSFANPLALLGLLVAVAVLNPWGIILPSSIRPETPLETAQHEPMAKQPVTASNLADKYRDSCPDHQFNSIRLLSRSPEIMIIDGFLTEEEAQVLIHMAYLSTSLNSPG